jgi:hypothetical protein
VILLISDDDGQVIPPLIKSNTQMQSVEGVIRMMKCVVVIVQILIGSVCQVVDMMIVEEVGRHRGCSWWEKRMVRSSSNRDWSRQCQYVKWYGCWMRNL